MIQPSTSGAEGKQVGSSDDDVIARKRRAEAAAERRAKIMAQMNKAQQKFATKNAIDLSKQLGLKGVKTGEKIGTPLAEADLDKFSDEQLSQLYELYSEAKKPIDKEKDPHLAS